MLESERQGAKSEIYVKRYPDITGGICEYCGVIDKLQPSEVQYLLPHVNSCPYGAAGGMGQLRCEYCPESIDPEEVVKTRKLVVHASPANPGRLLAVCDSYNCSQKHTDRFKKSV